MRIHHTHLLFMRTIELSLRLLFPVEVRIFGPRSQLDGHTWSFNVHNVWLLRVEFVALLAFKSAQILWKLAIFNWMAFKIARVKHSPKTSCFLHNTICSSAPFLNIPRAQPRLFLAFFWKSLRLGSNLIFVQCARDTSNLDFRAPRNHRVTKAVKCETEKSA